MMDKEITYDPNNPDIMEIENVGRVEYLEFEETIWIWNVYSYQKGKGTQLARAFIRYARSVGKSIYGRAKAKDNVTSMELDRLMRWYRKLGGVPVKMKDNPTAMKLEIGNGRS